VEFGSRCGDVWGCDVERGSSIGLAFSLAFRTRVAKSGEEAVPGDLKTERRLEGVEVLD
jgi:hypothetical protein